jgi:hypothetical protein
MPNCIGLREIYEGMPYPDRNDPMITSIHDTESVRLMRIGEEWYFTSGSVHPQISLGTMINTSVNISYLLKAHQGALISRISSF